MNKNKTIIIAEAGVNHNGTTLKHEVIKSKVLTEKEYNKIMNPMLMTKPK